MSHKRKHQETKDDFTHTIRPVIQRFYLNETIKKQLRKQTPNFGFNGLGEVVFRRTYSRNNEDWHDVVIRVIEGVMSIRKEHFYRNSLYWNDFEWQSFASEMAQSMFIMEWLPPGRGLWMMGTDFVYNRGAMGLLNCAATSTKEDIVLSAEWTMDALMNGVGCIPSDTDVMTEHGLRAIKEINIGDNVWSYNTTTNELELKPVTELHFPIIEKKNNIKIIGKFGSITTSKKHPVLVYDNGEWIYKLGQYVKKGDIIQKFCYERNEFVKFNQKAWFVGAFLGDGCSDIVKTGSRRIRLCKDNQELVEKFSNVLEQMSGLKVSYTVDNRSVNMWKVEKQFPADNRISIEWDSLVGDLPTKKTYKTDIPQWIKETRDSNVFVSFLWGLIDTDGSINGSKLYISTSSETLAKSLLKYSPLFGLHPWMHKHSYVNHNNTGYKMTTDNYSVYYHTWDFKDYLTFCHNSSKYEKTHEFFSKQNRYSSCKKSLVIPPNMVNTEVSELGLDNTKWHFIKKLEKDGFIGAGYYTSRNKSYDHLLKYDIVQDTEDFLDIDENWRDISVKDNSNYFTGEGSFYCSHNCGFDTNWRGVATKPDKNKFEVFIIPDSREGWNESLAKLMCSYIDSPRYGKNNFPRFDYSKIRPSGQPIKGFGGLASGPEPLKKMHDRIEGYLDCFCDGYIVVNEQKKEYNHTRLIADIFNSIGACVVAG